MKLVLLVMPIDGMGVRKELKSILKENMREIKLTQGKVALVDDVDYEYLSRWKWYAAWDYNCFRARRNEPKVNGRQKTIRMHRVVAERMGIDSKMIDHKDQNPLNNQRSNLRSATYSQSNHNRGAHSNSKTGVKGVYLRKNGRYRARIMVKGKYHYLGDYDTIAEAEEVIIAKRKKLVGEFAAA